MIGKRNKNRGYKQLRVWQDAIELYIIADKSFRLPYRYQKSVSNAMDACLSISRNIAEGYCRKGIKEYLNFLNISIASAGEFHSVLYTFFKLGEIEETKFEEIDSLLFKVENQLIKLIESLKVKKQNGDWIDSYS